MALYKGEKELLLCKGDRLPYALYKGDKKIAGATVETVTGDGRVEYESPYKGNLKSVAVKGSAEQGSFEGYNLFDVSKVGTTQRVTNNGDGTLTIQTPAFSSGTRGGGVLSDYCPSLIVGKTYTLNADTTGTAKYIYLDAVSKYWSFRTAITITQEMLGSPVSWYASGVSTIAVISNIMVVEGTYTAETMPSYEPYTGGLPAPNPYYSIYPTFVKPTVTSKGRNLLDGSIRTKPFDQQGVTIQYLEDEDCFLLNGTRSAGALRGRIYRNIFRGRGKTIRIFHEVLSGSCTIPDGGHCLYSIGSIDTIGDSINFLYSLNFAEKQGDVSKVLNFEYIGVDWFYITEGVVCDNLKVRIMLYEGEEKKPYEPYIDGGTTELPELYATLDGTCADEVDVQTGAKTVRMKKLVFDGTEKWRIFIDGVYLELIHDPTYNGICSHFIHTNSYELTVGLWSSVINKYAIHFLGYTDVDEFKAYLAEQYAAGTPVTVWYAVEEESTEDIEMTPLQQTGGYGQVVQTDDGLTAPMAVEYFGKFEG